MTRSTRNARRRAAKQRHALAAPALGIVPVPAGASYAPHLSDEAVAAFGYERVPGHPAFVRTRSAA